MDGLYLKRTLVWNLDSLNIHDQSNFGMNIKQYDLIMNLIPKKGRFGIKFFMNGIVLAPHESGKIH